MVVELVAALLPDVPDRSSRIRAYEDMYGLRCGGGFAAMRFQWPNEAAATSISDDSHLAGPSAEPAMEYDSGLDVN